MNFTYYGHACFSLSINGKILLFDPFINGNQLAHHIDIDSIQADYIMVSHGHADHIADCERIATRTGATVVCSWEVHEWLAAKGLKHLHPMNTGGSWTFDFGKIKCVVAQHSSGLPDGSYGGNPMGFLIEYNDGYIYYSGDTALTMDMQLIPLWGKVHCAILPIGNNFTMDYQDACLAADFVKTDQVIGVHYDTFGFIKIDAAEASAYFTNKGKSLTLVEIGKSITLAI